MYSFFFPVQWNVHVVEGARTATVGPRYKLHIRDNKTTRWNKPGFQKNTTVYHTWNMFTGTVMQVRNKPLHHFSTVILASVTCNRNLSVPPCLGFQQQGKLFLIFFLCQSFLWNLGGGDITTCSHSWNDLEDWWNSILQQYHLSCDWFFPSLPAFCHAAIVMPRGRAFTHRWNTFI